MKPVLLDLFSGAGGAAVGYHRAGFEVVGVDHKPQPRYPFKFLEADALDFLRCLTAGASSLGYYLNDFDAIHASPPCQAYSTATKAMRVIGKRYPDLISQVRDLLIQSELPWVIENVPGSPLRQDFRLCGCMFSLPMLRRQRIFETSWHGFALTPPCRHTLPSLSVTGNGVGAGNGQRAAIAAVLGRNPGAADARAAMGIDWMTRRELAQAIPPAYTEYIGRQLYRVVTGASC